MTGKPLIEINRQAMELLYRELGIVDTVRFLKQFTTGLGDYTVEREALFAGKTLDQIVNDIARMRPSHPPQTGAADEPAR